MRLRCRRGGLWPSATHPHTAHMHNAVGASFSVSYADVPPVTFGKEKDESPTGDMVQANIDIRPAENKSRGLKRDVVVYLKFIRMHLLIGLQYKGWWLMVLAVFVTCFTDILPAYLLFSRMGNVGAWSWERILLIYSLAVTSFGLAESFCRGFDYFPWQMLRSGNFDRLLLRPRSLTTQVAGSFFHIHRLARVTIGLSAAIWALGRLGVGATPFSVSVITLALIGGALVYSGVFVMSSGISFYTIKALDWIYIVTNASYQVTRIPIDYMPPIFRRAFTFIMPMLVISYMPAAAVCGWNDAHPLTGYLALPAGIVFLALSHLVWKVGVRRYQSTGS